jgi:hypothetical protein
MYQVDNYRLVHMFGLPLILASVAFGPIQFEIKKIIKQHL